MSEKISLDSSDIGIYLIKFETAPVVHSFECFLL
jgi:hypothetical protein